MRQSKLQSFIEVCIGTAVGFVLSLFLQLFYNWYYDLPLTLGKSMKMITAFTVLSLVRSYYMRRAFDKFHHMQRQKELENERL